MKTENIQDVLDEIRHENLSDFLLFKTIFDLAEDVFDITDEKMLILLSSNTKQDVEADIIYFLEKIIFYILKVLRIMFAQDGEYHEFFSKEYLQTRELMNLLIELERIFAQITEYVRDCADKKKIEARLKQDIDKRFEFLDKN